jgi:hypothetical protein
MSDDFPGLGFFPTEDPSGEVADVEVADVTIGALNAINLGDGEATVAFEANIKFTASISFADPESSYRDGDGEWFSPNWRSGNVTSEAPVAGVAKIALNEDWTAITRIVQLSIETADLSVDGFPGIDAFRTQ